MPDKEELVELLTRMLARIGPGMTGMMQAQEMLVDAELDTPEWLECVPKEQRMQVVVYELGGYTDEPPTRRAVEFGDTLAEACEHSKVGYLTGLAEEWKKTRSILRELGARDVGVETTKDANEQYKQLFDKLSQSNQDWNRQ